MEEALKRFLVLTIALATALALDAAELAGMRAAHLRDGAAMARFLCWLDGALANGGTLTEIDAVSRLEAFRAAGGDLSLRGGGAAPDLRGRRRRPPGRRAARAPAGHRRGAASPGS